MIIMNSFLELWVQGLILLFFHVLIPFHDWFELTRFIIINNFCLSCIAGYLELHHKPKHIFSQSVASWPLWCHWALIVQVPHIYVPSLK